MKWSLFVEAIALQFGLAFLIAVGNWNDFYCTGRYNKIIDSLIEYHPDTDYGIEVERKLYWYFKYIVSTYKIRLFDNFSNE